MILLLGLEFCDRILERSRILPRFTRLILNCVLVNFQTAYFPFQNFKNCIGLYVFHIAS